MNWIKNRLNARDETGAVAVIVAMCMVMFCGFAALAVDGGIAYAADRQHSVTADASSLAGAQAAGKDFRAEYPDGWGPLGCSDVRVQEFLPEAQTAAIEVYRANDPEGSVGDPTVTIRCADGNAPEGAFVVEVVTHGEVDTVFGAVFNVDQMHPSGDAVAIVSGSPAYGGLRPYAVCESDFAGGPTIGTTYQTRYAQNAAHDTSACKTVAGNWGLMNFDGHSPNTPELRAWTLNGYPGAITFPTTISGSPGSPFNAVEPQLRQLVNTTSNPANDVVIMLPVVNGWTGHGHGGEAYAPGVLTVKLCGFTDSPNHAVPAANRDPSCWSPTLFAQADSHDHFVFQWKVMDYSTSYTSTGSAGESACSLEDADCVPAIRLWRNP